MAETIKKEGMEGCLSDWISPEQVQNAPPPHIHLHADPEIIHSYFPISVNTGNCLPSHSITY